MARLMLGLPSLKGKLANYADKYAASKTEKTRRLARAGTAELCLQRGAAPHRGHAEA